MEEIVPVVAGEWVCGENGVWKFIARTGQLARCVGIGKKTSYVEIENAVSNIFSINRKTSGVSLTFSYPVESYVFREGKMPPVAITSDLEFQLYKVKLEKHGGLNLYLTVYKLREEETFDVDTSSDTSEFLASVDEMEARYKERQRENAEKVNGGSTEKWKQSTQSCGQKRIGGVGLDKVVIDNGTPLVDDMDNSEYLASVDEMEARYETRQIENAEKVSSGITEKWKHSRQSCGQKRIGGVGLDKVVIDNGTLLVDDMDNSEYLASVDEMEARYEARQIENAEKVSCGITEKWKHSRQSCGQKRIGGVVDKVVIDNGTPSVDDPVVGTINNGVYNSVDNNSNREETRSVDNNYRIGVNNVDNITSGGNISVDNSYSVGDKSVANTNIRGENYLDYAESVDNCVDNSDRAEMDLSSNESGGEEEDYNFDEWTDRINQDYPSDWDPYVLGATSRYGHMALLADVQNGISEVGERISLGHDLTHLGFSQGIEEDGTCDVPEDFNPNVMSADEAQVLATVAGLIDREDPLLLHDAPPLNDSQECVVDTIKGDEGIYVGRIFENKKQLRNVLSKYAMQKVFSYRVPKSDKRRVIAQCIDNKCGWRVYATYHPHSHNLEIKTLNLDHICDVSARGRYGEKATSTILGELLEGKYANGKKGPRACDLPEMVLAEHNVAISYRKAWLAKELALSASRGTEEDSFEYLSTYLHLLKSTNPGTITEMSTTYDTEGQTLFKYLFFAFGASIAGYKYLRKVIIIDGTAIKGKYKGVLVAASGQDGNRQIFPLGFGIVDGETIPGWVWFFENLKRFVPDEEELVFVSDRHQSIYAGLRKVYPRAQHGACVVHLCRNVVHNFHCQGLASTVSKAAKAYTVGEFWYHWDEIEKRNPKCAAHLLNIGLSHWTLAYFKGMRYNLMNSNISESLNTALTKAVDYPIAAMVEYIRTMLMNWFCYRRSKAGKAKTKCMRKVEPILVDHLTKSTDCQVLGASNWIYQVNDGKGTVFIVDLENKTCTCRVFDMLLIPCSHALAARRVRNVDEHTLVGECYSVSHWRKLYSGVIMPIKNEKDTYIPEDVTDVAVKPPRSRRPSGRPRKVRIPSQGEIHHAKKRKTENKCARCSGTGHNRRSCKNVI